MDAITLLKDDHKTVQKHIRDFERAGPRALAARGHAAQALVRELAVHSALEEQVFYPSVRQEVGDAEAEVLQSLEEHHVVKWLCSEIESMAPEDERFVAKVTVLIDNVRNHIEAEESYLFPVVREALGRKRLGDIGELMEKAKPLAPTRPHPRAPDSPPANAVAGVVAGAFDRMRDMVGHLTP
jgi:hemerythrin-like domain-containing protein